MVQDARVRFDHVSIEAPFGSLRDTGFVVAPTPGGDGRHGRVYLDGGYLEINEMAGTEPTTKARGWFCICADLAAETKRLRSLGLATAPPSPYDGYDGRWLDAELLMPGLGTAAPILSERLQPVCWPPADVPRHPNGVRSLGELHIASATTGDLERVLVAVGAVAVGGQLRLDCGLRVVIERRDDRIGPTLLRFAASDGELEMVLD